MSTTPTHAELLEYLDEGKRLVSALIEENSRLRGQQGVTQTETTGSDGAPEASFAEQAAEAEDGDGGQHRGAQGDDMMLRLRALESNVNELRAENHVLKKRFNYLEEENKDFSDRCLMAERQNSDLITMYVASYRLHSTLQYSEVMKIIKEIIINMIGAEHFAIYLDEDDPEGLVVTEQEGMPFLQGAKAPRDEGVVGRVVSSGVPALRPEPDEPESDNTDNPLACIPLRLGDRIVGAVAIFHLTPQKDGFTSLDHGVFELLERHAAVALYGARIHSLPEEHRRSVETLVREQRQTA